MRPFAAHFGNDALEKSRRIVVLDALPAFGDEPLYVYVDGDERVQLGRGQPRFVAFCDSSESVRLWIRHGKVGD